MWPCVRVSSEVYSLGTMPRKPDKSAGFSKRVKSPTSAHSPAAVSVSMLRKQRSRPTDRLGVAAVRDGRLEHAAQRLAALGERLHRTQVVHEYRLRERILEVQRAQPALVLLGPGFASKAHPAAHRVKNSRDRLRLVNVQAD